MGGGATRSLAEHVRLRSSEWAFAKRYTDMHGWQSSCAPPCSLLNGSFLAAEGLLPHPWSSSSTADRLTHALAGKLSGRRQRLLATTQLTGRTLRVRTPVQDGFWVRPLFVMVQGLWATLMGMPFFVSPHLDGACQRGKASCKPAVSTCPSAICDAYYDPAHGGNAWEQYFEPIGGIPAAEVEAQTAQESIVELDPQVAWLLYLIFDVIYPSSAAGALAQRSFVALLVRHWVRVVPPIAALADRQWGSQVLAAAGGHPSPVVLGVHIRGTDKNIGKIITPRHYFPLIDQFVAKRGKVGRRMGSREQHTAASRASLQRLSLHRPACHAALAATRRHLPGDR